MHFASRARHRLLLVAVPLLALAAAAGCSSTSASAVGAASAVPSTQPSAVAAFPVTITHALGSTTIDSAPERVVTVGYTDAEPVLALGIQPVGVSSWFGQDIDLTWPWVKEKWAGVTPQFVNDETGGFKYEQIAALKPDLILGLYAELDADQYAKLSAIAPTVAQSADYPSYTTPWTDMTHTAGKALGKEAEAQSLIDDIQNSFATVRQEHPEFAEKTAAVVDPTGGSFWPFHSTDPRGVFMGSLGYQPATELDAFIGDKFGTELSQERLDLLEVDQLVVLANQQTKDDLAANALYQALSVVKDGRALEIAYDEAPAIGAAIAYNSVLSIPYAIDGIVPLLAQ